MPIEAVASAKAFTFTLPGGEPLTVGDLEAGKARDLDPDGTGTSKLMRKPSVWPRSDSRKLNQDLADASTAHRSLVERGVLTAEACIQAAEPKVYKYLDRIVPKTFTFLLLEPGGDELLADMKAAAPHDTHVSVESSTRSANAVVERWVTLVVRPDDRLTINDTLNIFLNDADGRKWNRYSFVVQNQHEVTLSIIWQHLVPQRAVVGRAKLRQLYADGLLMLPDTFIGAHLQCRLPNKTGAEGSDKSDLWKEPATARAQLAQAIEHATNRAKVLCYLTKLEKAGLLGRVPAAQRPSFYEQDAPPTAQRKRRRL